jgi:hypothetical protein
MSKNRCWFINYSLGQLSASFRTMASDLGSFAFKAVIYNNLVVVYIYSLFAQRNYMVVSFA